MIKVLNDWCIDANDRQFTVGEMQDVVVKNPKTGETIIEKRFKSPSYFSSVCGCLKHIMAVEQRRSVSNSQMDLRATVTEFQRLQTMFEKLLSEIKEEI